MGGESYRRKENAEKEEERNRVPGIRSGSLKKIKPLKKVVRQQDDRFGPGQPNLKDGEKKGSRNEEKGESA